MTNEHEQTIIDAVSQKLTGDLTGTRFTTQMGLVRRVMGPADGNDGYWRTVSEDDATDESTYWWGGYVLEHRV